MPGHAIQRPMMIEERASMMIPRIIATIQQIIDGIIKETQITKPINPKQNTT